MQIPCIRNEEPLYGIRLKFDSTSQLYAHRKRSKHAGRLLVSRSETPGPIQSLRRTGYCRIELLVKAKIGHYFCA